MDKSNIELLKKLKTLAERGVGGEKENAATKLSELMAKYGVSEADLSDDVLNDYEFVYKDQYQRKILIQIFYKVNHERDVLRYRHGRGQRSVLLFRATAAEALEVRLEYDFYCDLWDDEVKFFLEAFIQKHRIFWDNPDPEPDSYWDRDKLSRLGLMVDAMQDKAYQRRLEGTP